MRVGLRIDVDTLRGTTLGVPRLLQLLEARGITASFFFSVGPDNMGRHLWRLLRPAFLWKMLRTGAPSLYGWDILLRGTFWPGPMIGNRCRDIIRSAAEAGHEIGIHAWDHHAWQKHVDELTPEEVTSILQRGVETLTEITGRPPTCSAAPGWRCNDTVLQAKRSFAFEYNSDCRGDRMFRPVVDGEELEQVQIPVSLPTYDEVVGRSIDAQAYNSHMLDLLRDDQLNVLTIHAEVEGISCADMFDRFLTEAAKRGAEFSPLGDLMRNESAISPGQMAAGSVAGREGSVACLTS